MTIFRPATRKIATALGVAAIAMGAMTASALPARAEPDDMMKVIAGVAAIAIIGSALNDNDRHHRPAPVMRPEPPRPQPGWHKPRPQYPGWHRHEPPRPPVAHPRAYPCGPYGCARPAPGYGHYQPRPQPYRHHDHHYDPRRDREVMHPSR